MQTEKRIVIAGGAGWLGRHLTNYLAARGYGIVVLTRSPQTNGLPARQIAWDGKSLGAWTKELEGAAAVINLAGRSVNCRYNDANRYAIYESRLGPTRILGAAIAQCIQPPRVWLNASSATIYRHALDRPMDEATGELGSGFSVDVCQQWERALNEAETPHTRRLALRTAMVFGEGAGGVFEAFQRIVRLGLGGTLGAGTQYVSWIHIKDFDRAIAWVLEHEEFSGAINLAAPNPLPNHEFMRTFRQFCRQPIGLPATAWMLEIGAFFLRTETELLLKSRRVVPRRLLETGFQFKYPQWREALSNIVNPDLVTPLVEPSVNKQ
jgi:uncharacterized protein